MSDLETLREELGEVDRQILALVARRQALAREIGRRKESSGKPTRDFNQERVVVERARQHARDAGLAPSLGEALILQLIQASLMAQEQDKVASSAGGQGRRALVIGGSGLMGRWFVRFLDTQGYQVSVADPAGGVQGYEHHAQWRDATLDHDLIVLAAPMRATNDILHELAQRRPPGLVFDIGSLKSPLRSGLEAARAAGLRIASMHPMFGPTTDLLSGRHVIFINDLGDPEAEAQARALFDATMAVQVSMDLESHDRLIAYVLGLSHALNIAFLTALVDSGEAAQRLAQLSSTTFDAQLGVASKVAAENPALYFEIQSLNDYGTESLTALLYAVERVRSVVRAGDTEGFANLMRRGLTWLSPQSDASP